MPDLQRDYSFLNTGMPRATVAAKASLVEGLAAANGEATPVLTSLPEPFHLSVMRMAMLAGAAAEPTAIANDAPVRHNNVHKLGFNPQLTPGK